MTLILTFIIWQNILQLFECASAHIPVLNSTFWPQKSTTKKQLFLQAVCRAKTIAATQKLHFFKQLSLNLLEVAIYFTCSIRRNEIVTAQRDGLSLMDIKEYLTAIYDGNWWVAYVMDIIQADEEADLNFLHPHRSSPRHSIQRTQKKYMRPCKESEYVKRETTACEYILISL